MNSALEPMFSDLIGKRVIVIWRDRADADWIAFRLIDDFDGRVKLQGVDSPDGSKHDGSFASASHRDIRDIFEWKEGA